MLSSVKGRLESADLNAPEADEVQRILWSRPLIGVGAAAILYFFMASGLLGGTAFTVFPQTDSAQTAPQNSARGSERADVRLGADEHGAAHAARC